MNAFHAIEYYLLVIHYSIFLPFTSRFPKRSLSIKFYNRNVYAHNASLPCTSSKRPTYPILLDFVSLIVLGECHQLWKYSVIHIFITHRYRYNRSVLCSDRKGFIVMWCKIHLIVFMFVPCINSIKVLLLFHNDAQNYKITRILKQLKFRQSLRHVSVHVGTIIREPFLCLAKTALKLHFCLIF
jgi:hypothetical protein